MKTNYNVLLHLHRQLGALHPGRRPAERDGQVARFKAFSAGSHPKGERAIRSRWKSCRRCTFRPRACAARAGMSSPRPMRRSMDFVFTVCDERRRRGVPGVAGPADERRIGACRTRHACKGRTRRSGKAFSDTAITIKRRLELMLALAAGAAWTRWRAARGRASDALTDGSERSAQAARRGARHRAAAGRGHRLRHDGRAPGGRQRGDRAAGQHARDRGRPLRAHRGVRSRQRRALQSGRVAGDGQPRRAGHRLLAPYIAVQLRRCDARCVAGPCHVRHEHPAVLDQGAQRHWDSGSPKAWPLSACCCSSCARRRRGSPRWWRRYIGAAYWFTASTSFANPAAAFGRMFSDSFAGIAPSSVPGFVIAELAGRRPGGGSAPPVGRLTGQGARQTRRSRAPCLCDPPWLKQPSTTTPSCGTSRNTLALMRHAGIEPVVIEYLKTPPSKSMLKALVQAMGISVRDALAAQRARPTTSCTSTTRSGPTTNCSTSSSAIPS